MFTQEVKDAKKYIDLFKPLDNIPAEVQLLLDRECLEGIPPVKIYHPQVRLVNEINSEEILETISFAGRMAWQKDWNRDPEKFVEHIIKMGHESVIEHVNFNFAILLDRITTQELERHRIGTSFTQESQRYVSYEDVNVPAPIVISPDWNKDAMYFITDGAITAVSEYRGAVSFAGMKPEVARQVLPNCMGSIVFLTLNPRSLRHFLNLRMAKGAYSPIRCIANEIYDIMVSSGLEVFVKDFADLRQYDPRVIIEEED